MNPALNVDLDRLLVPSNKQYFRRAYNFPAWLLLRLWSIHERKESLRMTRKIIQRLTVVLDRMFRNE
jgi:hypothetical protein